MNENNETKDTKQYIVVKLQNEFYAIDIKYINNIVKMQRITRVPKAQKYFKGVINLRGEIIPVMSLRIRFDLEADEFTNKSRILIIKPDNQGVFGIIVDEVKEVVNISDEEIDKVSYDGNVDEKVQFITGVGRLGDNLVSIMNIVGVITDKDKDKE
ncbi:MAG: chemotaxis protein CheW [Lachnospiraceae bacterium]|nr:chemotaxis protein CheW [Lachnospiraceae bacterium]